MVFSATGGQSKLVAVASTERKYDLYGPEFRADPHATFARMREHDPVLCQPGIDGETMIWFLTRHETWPRCCSTTSASSATSASR
jgi:hypothetical protein